MVLLAAMAALGLSASANWEKRDSGERGHAPQETSAGRERPGTWASGVKDGFGTAYEAYDASLGYSDQSSTAPISRVWFTLSRGAVTEISWPTVDRPQTKMGRFLVTDGRSWTWDEADWRLPSHWSETEWDAAGVPTFRVRSGDSEKRFEIEKTILADRDRDVVIVRVRWSPKVDGLRLFYVHDPAVGNRHASDEAWATLGGEVTPPSSDVPVSGAGLFAWEGKEAQAIVFSETPIRATAGIEGASDGVTDLRDFALDWDYATAGPGNVVLTAELDAEKRDFALAIGFGADIREAEKSGRESLQHAWGSKSLSSNEGRFKMFLRRFEKDWLRYFYGLRDLRVGDRDGLYLRSLATLKSLEDKTRSGAMIAAPATPWGEFRQEGEGQNGGYHLVWPRDLFQMASAFIAAGDRETPVAALRYLATLQYTSGQWEYGTRKMPRAGSFPQNVWTGGQEYFGALQMDQTALAVHLAWRLWVTGLEGLDRSWSLSRAAADFLADHGPWSAQERWEENFGASPSTIAAEIGALWAASAMAERVGDFERAKRYRKTADAWAFQPGDNVSTWTFTESGKHGNGRYFTRVEGAAVYDQVWNPNDSTVFWIANGGGERAERDVTDAGFLELARFGARWANDSQILDSLPEVDSTLRVEFSCGPGFLRYLGDRYGYDDVTGQQTDGMVWPLLTGERAQFEVARWLRAGGSSAGARAIAAAGLRALSGFASPSGFFPEQVWADGPEAGRPTGAATPLGWAHAEYVRLLAAYADGAPYGLRARGAKAGVGIEGYRQ